MSDVTPEKDWETEPTEEEVRMFIEEIKRVLVAHYGLKTQEANTLTLAVPHKHMNRTHLTQEQLRYTIARNRLKRVVARQVPLFIPVKFHKLFEEMLRSWIPSIKQKPP